jgi:hypothetical protein
MGYTPRQAADVVMGRVMAVPLAEVQGEIERLDVLRRAIADSKDNYSYFIVQGLLRLRLPHGEAPAWSEARIREEAEGIAEIFVL